MVATRPDICYTVTRMYEDLAKPNSFHLTRAKHVLRYLKGTINQSLIFKKSQKPLKFEGFCDIYWANQSSIALAKNPVASQRSKHIHIKIQFIGNKYRVYSFRIHWNKEKCSRCVYKANDRNKIKHFHKNYNRQLSLNLIN